MTIRQNIICNRNKKVPVRKEQLNGRTHVVVPMIMLTEGVHKGSGDPYYYDKTDIANTTTLWDHKPVVVYHPMKKDGTPRTACDADVLNTSGIGVILNTTEDNGKLKAEAWIDEEKANSVDDRILKAVANGEMMEVSTGLFITEENKKGVWNSESYEKIARNYQPDHLAILPDQKGACSIEDGAGLLRVNSSEAQSTVLERTITKLPIGIIINKGEMSFDVVASKVSKALSSTLGNKGEYWNGWIREIFPEYVVFYDKGDFYKADYKIKTNGEVDLGKSLKVKVVSTYQVINEGVPMSKVFNKADHINNLISNGIYTEAERKELEALPDNILSGIKIPEPAPVANSKVPVTNSETGTPQVLKTNKTMTEDEFWAMAPAELRQQFTANKAAIEKEKENYIAQLTANTSNPFTPEFLKTKTLEELKGMVQLSGGQVNNGVPQMFYSGAAGGVVPVVNKVKAPEGLKIPQIDFSNK